MGRGCPPNLSQGTAGECDLDLRPPLQKDKKETQISRSTFNVWPKKRRHVNASISIIYLVTERRITGQSIYLTQTNQMYASCMSLAVTGETKWHNSGACAKSFVSSHCLQLVVIMCFQNRCFIVSYIPPGNARREPHHWLSTAKELLFRDRQDVR